MTFEVFATGQVEWTEANGTYHDEVVTKRVVGPVTALLDPNLIAPRGDLPGTDGTTVDVLVTEAFDEVCSLEFDVSGATDDTAVDDVGSRAAWKPSLQTPQLFVCTGSSFVTVTQYRPSSVTDDDALARAKAIAGVVLDSM